VIQLAASIAAVILIAYSFVRSANYLRNKFKNIIQQRHQLLAEQADEKRARMLEARRALAARIKAESLIEKEPKIADIANSLRNHPWQRRGNNRKRQRLQRRLRRHIRNPRVREAVYLIAKDENKKRRQP
jgi:hypothetical protein